MAKRPKTELELELLAIKKITGYLDDLDETQRLRVLSWLSGRYLQGPRAKGVVDQRVVDWAQGSTANA